MGRGASGCRTIRVKILQEVLHANHDQAGASSDGWRFRNFGGARAKQRECRGAAIVCWGESSAQSPGVAGIEMG